MSEPTPKEIELHNKFFNGLLDLIDEVQELGTHHVIYFGIQTFTQVAVDCAPTLKDARDVIKAAIKSVKKSAWVCLHL